MGYHLSGSIKLNFCKLEKNYIDYKTSFKSIKLLNAFASQSDEKVAFYEYTDEFHSAGSTFSKYKFDFNSRKNQNIKTYVTTFYNQRSLMLFDFIGKHRILRLARH